MCRLSAETNTMGQKSKAHNLQTRHVATSYWTAYGMRITMSTSKSYGQSSVACMGPIYVSKSAWFCALCNTPRDTHPTASLISSNVYLRDFLQGNLQCLDWVNNHANLLFYSRIYNTWAGGGGTKLSRQSLAHLAPMNWFSKQVLLVYFH